MNYQCMNIKFIFIAQVVLSVATIRLKYDLEADVIDFTD